MHWSDIPFDPPRSKLRQFGGICCLAALALAAWRVDADPDPRTGLLFATIGLVAGTLALLAPSLLRWVFVTAMIVVFPVSWMMSRLILAAMFYCVLTPIGSILRLAGHNPLQLRRTAETPTYWNEKKSAASPAGYLEQF